MLSFVSGSGVGVQILLGRFGGGRFGFIVGSTAGLVSLVSGNGVGVQILLGRFGRGRFGFIVGSTVGVFSFVPGNGVGLSTWASAGVANVKTHHTPKQSVTFLITNDSDVRFSANAYLMALQAHLSRFPLRHMA
jgi:hypothetical protein